MTGQVLLDGTAFEGAIARWMRIDPPQEGHGETDSDGRFVLSDLEAGLYQVFVIAESASGIFVTFQDQDADGEPDTIQLQEGEHFDFGALNLWPMVPEMPLPGPECPDPQAEIGGQIIFAEGGRPAAGAEISLSNISGIPLEESSAADGDFQFRALCAGEYHLFASLEEGEERFFGLYDADENGSPDPIRLQSDDSILDLGQIELLSIEEFRLRFGEPPDWPQGP